LDKLSKASIEKKKQMFLPLSYYDLVWDLKVTNALYAVIFDLCKEFEYVEVIEQYGNYLRLRIDRKDRTIGYIFK